MYWITANPETGQEACQEGNDDNSRYSPPSPTKGLTNPEKGAVEHHECKFDTINTNPENKHSTEADVEESRLVDCVDTSLMRQVELLDLDKDA